MPVIQRSHLLKTGLKLHRWLGWLAFGALLLFILSGISHPLMTWTGPQQASFFPPQASISAEDIRAVPAVLQQHAITQARLVKVVPSAQGNLLQVTEQQFAPRRYFELQTGIELADYDRQQAEWLARYFTGLEHAPLEEISLQTEFDDAYPPVNRLLPVYRVAFASDDNRVAYIYTEQAALANLTNDWKTALQTLFRNIHTLSWLDSQEWMRVALIIVLLLAVLSMTFSGLVIRFVMKNRQIRQAGRRWHRQLSLIIVLPVIAFAGSGLYHLLMHAGDDRQLALQLAPEYHIDLQAFSSDSDWIHNYHQMTLNNVTLLQGPNQQLLFRVSIPAGAMQQMLEHQHRFDGQPSEQPAHYYAVDTGQPVTLNDEQLAAFYASHYQQLDADRITGSQLVTGFSPEYDFRNKRLPVWRFDFATEDKLAVFIDPATGVLVDKSSANERLEAVIFGQLHKWNFAAPHLGRQGRDLLMVLVLLMVLGFAGLGVRMLLKQRRTA